MSELVKDEGLIPLEELEKMKNNQKVRDQMIETLTDGGMPTSPRDVEVLLSVLNSSDEMILKKATLKARDRANQTNENIAELAAKLLLSVNRNTGQITSTDRSIDLGLEVIPDDIVPGELDQGIQDVSYEDFVEAPTEE